MASIIALAGFVGAGWGLAAYALQRVANAAQTRAFWRLSR